jgi:hypothetical protein
MKKYYNDHSLVGKHTYFNKNMYEKYDIPAREKLLNLMGDVLIENPDIYNQDFIINDKLCKCKYKYLEVQVNANWEKINYPDSVISVYERKGKYDNDTLFITLNKIMTRGYIFDRKSFSNKPRRLKKYSREFVYDIQFNQAILVELECLDVLTFELF